MGMATRIPEALCGKERRVERPFSATGAAGAPEHFLAKAGRVSYDDTEGRNARLLCFRNKQAQIGDKGSRLRLTYCTFTFCL
jgi:hypothetical protein